MNFMRCKINTDDQNKRLGEILGSMSESDFQILDNAVQEAYQTGVDRTGVAYGVALILGTLVAHFAGNAIIKKRNQKK